MSRQNSANDQPQPTGRRGKWRLSIRAWPEGFLLALGLALLVIYGAAWADRFLAARQLHEFERLAAAPSLRKPDTGVPVPAAPGAEQAPQPDEAVVRKPGEPVGVLRIPRIHLEAPVLEGTGALTLNRGTGRIEGTAQPGEYGNIGIAGHRDSFFRGLRDVRLGDAIELGTPAGRSEYVVTQIQIVTPDRVDVLQPSAHPSLTLVTCYPFHYFGRAPRRYVVMAVLADPSKAPEAGTTVVPANPKP